MQNSSKKTLSSNSAQLIYNALLKAGADVSIISKKYNLLKVVYNGNRFFIKSTSFHINPQPSCIIANNKHLTKKVLEDANVLTPRSYLLNTSSQVKQLIKKRSFYPCVLKPTVGAHGNKVYANIESFKELKGVLPNIFSKNTNKSTLVEEYVAGADYRVLVVGDKVSAVMERIPAHVIGDGVSNIKELIKQFNSNPQVGVKYEKPMCKIRLNGEVKRNLRKQKINFRHVPKLNKQVFLRENANISTGGIGKDATSSAPQIVKTTAIKASKALGMKITGVDIIYNKLNKKAYVIELNDIPGIDIHHFPVLGAPQNVAKDIVDLLLLSNEVNNSLDKTTDSLFSRLSPILIPTQ